jgi:hypothetical protein
MTGTTKIAAILLTLAAIVYGLIPPFVDLTATHVFHPAWPAHARFHMVWQLAINTGLALFVFYLVWWPAGDRLARLKVAAILGFISLGGFVIASVTRHLYGGAFTDPGGVPPVGGMDVNVLAFTPAMAMQVIALALVFRQRERRG